MKAAMEGARPDLREKQVNRTQAQTIMPGSASIEWNSGQTAVKLVFRPDGSGQFTATRKGNPITDVCWMPEAEGFPGSDEFTEITIDKPFPEALE